MDRIPALHRHIKRLARTDRETGTIVSFTVIRHPPAGFGTEPYTVALIKLPSGTMICAQLTQGAMKPEIGAMVEPRMRRMSTMSNGLFVNDFKYEVVAPKKVQIAIQHYILALTGPSGVGKTTLTHSLLRLFRVRCEQVPIYTTRRVKHQSEGEPYRYVSAATFNAMIKRGEIVAHTTILSSLPRALYGYRREDIDRMWSQGTLPMVVANVDLLTGLCQAFGRRTILSCGILPPGTSRRSMLSALLHRLRRRGRESDEEIQTLLESAKSDLSAFETSPHLFDHLFVNDTLELCVENIRSVVK